MNKENIKNIEFADKRIISTLYRLSTEYNVAFDTLVNLAVLMFIDDVNLLRLLRAESLDIATLCEKVLS